jgi:hypothetical protein
MNTKSYLVVSAFLFSLVAGAHLLRGLGGWQLLIGGWQVPAATSLAAAAFAAAIALWGFRLASGAGSAGRGAPRP